MFPKFTEGQRVHHNYLGVAATIGTVHLDTETPRYDVVYDDHPSTFTVAESVLSADMSDDAHVVGVDVARVGIIQLRQQAIALRTVGMLTSYDTRTVVEVADRALVAMYERASQPTEYL